MPGQNPAMILPRPQHSHATPWPCQWQPNWWRRCQSVCRPRRAKMDVAWRSKPTQIPQKKSWENESLSQVGFTLPTKHQKRPEKIAKIFWRFTLFGSARCSSKVRIISTPKGLPRDKDTAATKGETPKPKVFGFGSQLNLVHFDGDKRKWNFKPGVESVQMLKSSFLNINYFEETLS